MRNCLSLLSFFAVVTTLYADLPPLIDRNSFFGEVKITAAQMSPDGKLHFVSETIQGYAQHLGEESRGAILCCQADECRSQASGRRLLLESRLQVLLYVQDQAGDENYNVYAVNPAAAPDKQSGVPPVRATSAMQRDARDDLRSPQERSGHSVYRLERSRQILARPVQASDFDRPDERCIRKNTERVAEWVFDQ